MHFKTKLLNFLKFTQFSFLISPLKFIAITLITALEGVIPVYSVVIIKNIVDLLTLESFEFSMFITLIITWLVLMTLQFSISILLRYLMNTFIFQAGRVCSEQIMNKGESLLGLKNLENSRFQDIYYYIKDADIKVENFVNNFRYLIKNSIQFATVLVVFLTISRWVPLLVLLSVIPGTILSAKKAKIVSEMEEEIYGLERKAGYYRDRIIDPIAFKEFKLFPFASLFRTKFETLSNSMIRKNLELNRKVVLLDTLGVLPRILCAGGIIIYFAYQSSLGLVSIGDITLFIGSIFQLSTSLAEIIQFWAYLDSTLMFFDRFLEFKGFKECVVQPTDGVKISKIESIEFQNVSFAYESREVLHNVSFKLEPESSVALVGENGAGKSTIIKLILRLYDPSAGEILVNNINIKDIDIDSLRESISGIFQDFQRFQVSVSENIQIGNNKIDLKSNPFSVDTGFIDNLDEKENTLLGKELGGTDLSGGQWQKIAILRAMSKNASLLLVDEPTSSIDPIQEAEIYKALLSTTGYTPPKLICMIIVKLQLVNFKVIFRYASFL